MNVKKFAQNKAKRLKPNLAYKNKENLHTFEDDSKFKQFSVDLHKLSFDFHNTHDKKSLLKDNISICIDNQSQYFNYNNNNKSFINVMSKEEDENKIGVESQLTNFVNRLDEGKKGIKKVLEEEINEDWQGKSDEMKRLINVLYRKVLQQENYQNESKQKIKQQHHLINKRQQCSFKQEQNISPYLRKELECMQNELSRLKTSKLELEEIRNTDRLQKQYIKNTLASVYQRQLKQVEELGLIN